MKHILSFFIAICLMVCGAAPALAAEPLSTAEGGDAYSALVKVTATDTDGAPVSGAVYGLYRLDDTFVLDMTTGEDGVAISAPIPTGQRYYLEELSLPEGVEKVGHRYNVNPINICVEVTYDFAYTYPVTVPKPEPEQLGRIQLTKRDAEGGKPLSGAVFGVFSAADAKVSELTTGADGVAVTADLPVGTYYLVEQTAPAGYAASTDRHPVMVEASVVSELTVTNTALPPAPEPDPTPTEKPGKLLITKVAEKTGEKLSGATFGVYEALSDKPVTELVTDHFGEAIAMLPAGEYYLRELKAPGGYALDTKRIPLRIQSEKLAELSVTNKLLPPTPEPDPTPTEKPGKLLIFKVADKSGEKLKGAVFGVYETLTDKLVTELVTDRYGEATKTLPAGEYYLRELEAPSGYTLDSSRIPFRIRSEKQEELTITNKAVPAKPDPTPTPDEKQGKLLITKKAADTGETLKGAVFGVYEALTEEQVDEVTTDRYGEASLSLPAGEYYLRERKAPEGFVRNTNRIAFRIASGKVKELTVTNKPVSEESTKPTPPVTPDKPANPTPPGNPGGSGSKPTAPAASADKGTLSLLKKAEGSGKPLSGAVFGVYNAQNSGKIGELTTAADGKAVLSLPAGRYYLLEQTAPQGYCKETAKILFAVKSGGTTVVEVTNMRDTNAMPEINIPQTGEPFPIGSYAGAAVCFVLAAMLGGALILRRKHTAPAK